MSLTDLGETYGTDKLAHGYLPHYERHLSDDCLCATKGTLLEIGVHEGGSLRMWRDWLPGWTILGVDNNPACMIEGEERIVTFLVDVGSDTLTDHWPEGFGVDVVIDDGSHQPGDQRAAFDALWPRLRAGGLYVIEDLRTCWLPEWGGHPEAPNVTAKFVGGAVLGCLLGNDPDMPSEVHAYEEICFLRKQG